MSAAFNVALNVPRLRCEEIRGVLQQLGAFQGHEVRNWHPSPPLAPPTTCVRSKQAPPPMQLDAAVEELPGEMPIKRLLLLLDLARQGVEEGERAVPLARWTGVIQDLMS